MSEENLKEPRKEDYGYQDESGWLLEGGEEAYQEAYERYIFMLDKQINTSCGTQGHSL